MLKKTDIVKMQCDVLVLGSGGAGLYAALEAAQAGAKVLVATKGRANRSGATLLAGANLNADVMCDGKTLYDLGVETGDREDSPEKWYQDLIHEGFYLNRRELVAQYVEQARVCVGQVLHDGVKLTDVSEGGRAIGVPGSALLDWLYKKGREAGVCYLEDTMLCDLVRASDGAAAGALLLEIPTGKLICVQAAATVLASGGMHNCYSFNSGSTGLTGDGQAAAMRFGAQMTLMEMVTFCPDVIYAPEKYRGNILPYIMDCIGIGRLYNKDKERFLHKHMSQRAENLAMNTEWNKLLLCYAMQKEVNAGFADHNGGITFDISYLTAEKRAQMLAAIPQMKNGLYKEILDYHDQNHGLTVFAACHYFDGGIRVDAQMQTSVPGLFAAGECTGGLFGANRVGAATTQMMVQGSCAGQSAARYAKQATRAGVEEASLEKAVLAATAPFACKDGLLARQERGTVVSTITASAGVLRKEQPMHEGLATLETYDAAQFCVAQKQPEYNREWLDYLETRNLIACGEGILKSSLARRESRGVFIREDHFYTDDTILQETVLQDGVVHLEDVAQKDVTCPAERHEYIENLEQVMQRLSYSFEEARG